MKSKTIRSVALGAGAGMIFGAALGHPGVGLVLGAAVGVMVDVAAGTGRRRPPDGKGPTAE